MPAAIVEKGRVRRPASPIRSTPTRIGLLQLDSPHRRRRRRGSRTIDGIVPRASNNLPHGLPLRRRAARSASTLRVPRRAAAVRATIARAAMVGVLVNELPVAGEAD